MKTDIGAEEESFRLKKLVRVLQEEREHFRHLLETEERGRRLIGYDIHDGLAQLLAAAMLQLSNFERFLHEDDTRAWKCFESGVGLVAQSLREARRLIHGLEPVELEEDGVVAAIEDLVSDANDQSEQQVDFVHDIGSARLPPPVEHAVFRIVQEALTNARRHSKSERILITLSRFDGNLHVKIEDWGIGFDPSQTVEGHFGLQGIQDRAILFGGQATIQSKSGWGTTVSVSLPVEVGCPAPV